MGVDAFLYNNIIPYAILLLLWLSLSLSLVLLLLIISHTLDRGVDEGTLRVSVCRWVGGFGSLGV